MLGEAADKPQTGFDGDSDELKAAGELKHHDQAEYVWTQLWGRTPSGAVKTSTAPLSCTS